MTPSVTIEKTDGNLGVATNTDRILAIIATALTGDTDKAFSWTNKNDVVEEHTSGPLVEASAYMIAQGVPVVGIRATPTTAGAYGSVDDSGVTGTATVDATAGSHPDGDYDVIVEVLTGGELGTAGIVFRWSNDAGVSWSPETSLGTALTIAIDGGVSFTLASATSTLIAGDKWTVTTTGPVLSSSDLATAFDALRDYTGEWLRVLVLTHADANVLAACDSFARSFHADGKYPEVVTNMRPRGATEDRADYQAALGAILATVQSSEVSPCPDQCEIVSSVSGRRLRMLPAIPYAARLMVIDDSVDAAAKALGALPDVFVVTSAGERKYHDERRFPGLDALGLTTLRTWGGRPVSPGVYINNPRLISGAGSDYRYFQLSAIENRIIETAFSLLNEKLSIAILLDETGKIRDDVAGAIEETVNVVLRTQYRDAKRVSNVRLRLSRTDDVLSTDTITFDTGTVPLGYAKKFKGKAGLVRVLST